MSPREYNDHDLRVAADISEIKSSLKGIESTLATIPSAIKTEIKTHTNECTLKKMRTREHIVTAGISTLFSAFIYWLSNRK